jgi:hypothetical protein
MRENINKAIDEVERRLNSHLDEQEKTIKMQIDLLL